MEAALDRAIHTLAATGRGWRYLLLLSGAMSVKVLIEFWPLNKETWYLPILRPTFVLLIAFLLYRLFNRAARFLGGESRLPEIRAATLIFMSIGLIASWCADGLQVLPVTSRLIEMMDQLIGLVIYIFSVRAVCRIYAFSFGRYLMAEIIRIYSLGGMVMSILIPLFLISEWTGWLK